MAEVIFGEPMASLPARVHALPSPGKLGPLWDVLPEGSLGNVIAVFERQEMAEFFVTAWNARQAPEEKVVLSTDMLPLFGESK